MKDFRNKLEKNNRTYRIFVAVSILCLIGMLVLRIVLGRTEAGSGPQSGMSGFFAAMIVVSLILIKRNNKALNDDKLLKELYIRNTDERTTAIEREASKAAFYIMMIATSIGMIVFTYLNQAVSYTLACVLGVMTIIYLGTHIYYNKKM